jgi:hypothetical protein
MSETILAVIKYGDNNHYLVEDFLQSLPKGTLKLTFTGFAGTLESCVKEYNLNKFCSKDTNIPKKNLRHFSLFRAPSLENLSTKYFSSTPEAKLIKIPNRLDVVINYHQDTGPNNCSKRYTESIDKAVQTYRQLASEDPWNLLCNSLENSEFLRKNLTKKLLLGFNKNKFKIPAVYVAVGLVTPDEEYVLNYTGVKGPYAGNLFYKESK